MILHSRARFWNYAIEIWMAIEFHYIIAPELEPIFHIN
jgi:hypothetical protein